MIIEDKVGGLYTILGKEILQAILSMVKTKAVEMYSKVKKKIKNIVEE